MSFDFFANLNALQTCPKECSLPHGLAAGFVDICSIVFYGAEIQRAELEKLEAQAQDKSQKEEPTKRYKQQKDQARRCYMIQAAKGELALPCELGLNSWPPDLLHQDWLALQVDFELLTPWYSKDDRFFHVLDNPVHKDWVFGVPFMAAASWKGMLRWACRMQAGLQKHLAEGKKFKDWNDPYWILHLFGNEKGEQQELHQGALVFYPTWFNKVGFEVINPHSRERRAGTQPIYYEVAPPEAKGTLCLLYAPWPGMKLLADPKDFLPNLLEATERLLTTYGISAKRTVGWGTAKIRKWQAFRKGQESEASESRHDFWQKVRSWFLGGSS